MNTDDVVNTLASLTPFEAVPRAELEWLVARGDVHHLAPGTTIVESGSAIDQMWLVLSGRAAVHVQKGPSWRNFYQVGPGNVVGAMPYSRALVAPAKVVAEDDAVAFALNRSHFPDLVRECPELTAVLVHNMIDRARWTMCRRRHGARARTSVRRTARGRRCGARDVSGGRPSEKPTLGGGPRRGILRVARSPRRRSTVGVYPGDSRHEFGGAGSFGRRAGAGDAE